MEIILEQNDREMQSAVVDAIVLTICSRLTKQGISYKPDGVGSNTIMIQLDYKNQNIFITWNKSLFKNLRVFNASTSTTKEFSIYENNFIENVIDYILENKTVTF